LLPDGHDFADPTRRTYLAQERTLLAWWRTGLATVAVALAVGRLLPAVAGAPKTPFVWLGAGFGLLALAQIAFGTWRHWTVSRALSEGRFDELPLAAVVAMTAFMAALIGTAVVVLFLDL
jgi:putative membrane protein